MHRSLIQIIRKNNSKANWKSSKNKMAWEVLRLGISKMQMKKAQCNCKKNISWKGEKYLKRK